MKYFTRVMLSLRLVLALLCAPTSMKALSNGDLDPTFNPGAVAPLVPGQVTTVFGTGISSDRVFAVAIQVDGKIVVAGSTDVNFGITESDFAVARYNTDGSLDASFNPGAVAPLVPGQVRTAFGIASTDLATTVAIQSDGKIVVGGITLVNIIPTLVDFALVRYNTDGSLDATFNPGAVPPLVPGQVRTSFGVGFTNDQMLSLAIQADGKIIAAGFSQAAAGPAVRDFALARYNTNGSLDGTFGVGGMVTTSFGTPDDQIFEVLIQPADGKIIAGGLTTNEFALARYNTNGSLDGTFGVSGKVTTSFGSPPTTSGARAAVLQADGKIIAAGFTDVLTGLNFALARYNDDGSLDTTFGSGGKIVTAFDSGYSSDQAFGVATRIDGKIVVAGNTSVGGNNDFAVAQYIYNGSLDVTFGNGGKVTTVFGNGSSDAQAYAVAIQADGKIVVAGYSNVSGTTGYDFALARYIDTQQPFVGQKVVCTNCGPFVIGHRGCARSLLYAVGDEVIEHTIYAKRDPYVITSINPSCYDFETTVTVVCESCLP